MNSILVGIIDWIKDDYKTSPLRFYLEVVAWAISIGCSLVMAVTVPNPPLLVLYPIWIAGCIIYAWCAYTRQSFGMLANYTLIVCIDSVGLVRMLTKYF
jgi:cellulose synthase/poly-beta-1,6-N-acetylglucosamine synthase-like glycosyltransferase